MKCRQGGIGSPQTEKPPEGVFCGSVRTCGWPVRASLRSIRSLLEERAGSYLIHRVLYHTSEQCQEEDSQWSGFLVWT